MALFAQDKNLAMELVRSAEAAVNGIQPPVGNN